MREKGHMVVRGRRAPVVGTVCMDLTMLDVTHRPDAVEATRPSSSATTPRPGTWPISAGTNAWRR
jgi:hypothetical protein